MIFNIEIVKYRKTFKSDNAKYISLLLELYYAVCNVREKKITEDFIKKLLYLNAVHFIMQDYQPQMIRLVCHTNFEG